MTHILRLRKCSFQKKIQRMNKAKDDFHKLIDNYSITEEDLFMTDFILGKVGIKKTVFQYPNFERTKEYWAGWILSYYFPRYSPQ